MKKSIAILLTVVLMLAVCCGAYAESYTVGVCQLMVHDSLDQATQGFADALNKAAEEAGHSVEIDILHICFLVGLTSYMGITPNVESFSPGYYFDMQEGVFVSHRPLNNPFLPPMEAAFMVKLMRINYVNMRRFRFSRGERRIILDRILSYYALHYTGMGQLSSPAVLHALFD